MREGDELNFEFFIRNNKNVITSFLLMTNDTRNKRLLFGGSRETKNKETLLRNPTTSTVSRHVTHGTF